MLYMLICSKNLSNLKHNDEINFFRETQKSINEYHEHYQVRIIKQHTHSLTTCNQFQLSFLCSINS